MTKNPFLKRFKRFSYLQGMANPIQAEGRPCQGPGCKKLIPNEIRKDKKFCSDYCRTAYHNPQRKSLDPEVVRINKILQTNFEILEEIFASPHHSVERDVMMRKGFSFDYYTQVYNEYCFCYSYGYKDRGKKVSVVKGFDSIVKKL